MDADGHVITTSDMDYDELIEYCDWLWEQVETG